MSIEGLVKKAQSGDKISLGKVVLAIQDNIYYLSLRMLCNPEDAKDATQEIIIRVITKLSTFKFNSQFRTWVYRVATNYLLNAKKVLAKNSSLSFEIYRQELESDLSEPAELKNSPEYPLMLNEIRIACTMAMLLCLNHKHRMAYILGEIMEIEADEASEIMSVSNDNYRKLLSRARKKVVDFTGKSCGLISNVAKCRCEDKLTGAINRGRVDEHNIVFADKDSKTYRQTLNAIQKINDFRLELRTKTAQRSVPTFKSIVDYSKEVEALSSRL